jgi:hypothetical protein
MTLELVEKEDCTSIENRGKRVKDRKKLEDKKKEITTTKKIIITKRGHKYIILVYRDEKTHKQKRMYLGRVDKQKIE